MTCHHSTLQLKAVEIVQKSGAIEGAETHNAKKSATIAQRVEENRREEDKEGELALVEATCMSYVRTCM